jgi:hypothetical protein
MAAMPAREEVTGARGFATRFAGMCLIFGHGRRLAVDVYEAACQGRKAKDSTGKKKPATTRFRRRMISGIEGWISLPGV